MEFNVKALETLVNDAGSPPKLERVMYQAMGEGGWVGTTPIKKYLDRKGIPSPEIVEKFIAYAHRIGQQELEFYKTHEDGSLPTQE